MRILLATTNPGKIRELSLLISNPQWELTTPAREGIDITVQETGRTFEENATIKALAYARASDLITLADDSGLEVDALNGEPGVRSARYAGEGASDRDKIDLLLGKLAGVQWEKRTARFRCVIAVAFPDGRVELCSGACEGVVALVPSGEGGFGYDPAFYFPEYGRTMAELSDEEKNKVSHRGKAAAKARDFLLQLVG